MSPRRRIGKEMARVSSTVAGMLCGVREAGGESTLEDDGSIGGQRELRDREVLGEAVESAGYGAEVWETSLSVLEIELRKAVLAESRRL